VNKIVTLLTILANICGGALLLFHLCGWMNVSEDQVSQAVAYFLAGSASVVLIAGVANDIFQGSRRALGIAIFLAAIWVTSAPILELDTARQKIDAFFPRMAKHPTLIATLFLFILARMAIFGARQPLGYAIALLAPVFLCLKAGMMGGLVMKTGMMGGVSAQDIDDIYYYGLISIMAFFTVMLCLGPGYQNLASWALCILLVLGGAYHILT